MNPVVKKSSLPFAAFAAVFIAAACAAAATGYYYLLALPFGIIFFYAAWHHPEYFYFLLLAAIPFSVEYNFTPALGTDIPDEFLMLLVAFVFLGYALYKPDVAGAGTFRHPLLLVLIVYGIWLLVTVIFSSQPLVAFKYLLAKCWYAGAFVLAPLLVLRNKQNIVKAAVILVAGVILVTMIILYRHSQTGFSFASASDAVQPFFRNHVNYSALLVCSIPIVWFARQHTKNRQMKRLLLACTGLMLSGLFFSYARGAWLALPVGIVSYILIRKKWFFYSFLLAVLLAVFFVFWIKSNDRYLRLAHDYQTTVFHKDFSEHLVSTYRLKDLSTAERFYRWIAGVRMIREEWLTGYGPNSFFDNYKPWAVPAFKTWVSDNPERSTVHNYFLLLAIEQGIPGLLFFLILLGTMCWYAQRLFHQAKDPFYKTTAATAGIIVAMITWLNGLSDLIETDKVGSLFFSCLSLLIITDMYTRKKSDPSPHIEGVAQTIAE